MRRERKGSPGAKIERFLAPFRRWAEPRPDVEAIALVGSRARGTAKADSDVDVVMIVRDPSVYENDDDWLRQFGVPQRIAREDWGRVQSRRVFYEDGSEVEFGVTTAAWIAADPVDAETSRVIADGARVLLDKSGGLAMLIARVRGADGEPAGGCGAACDGLP